MVKVNLITLEATIDSCLEGRLNRAIQHILFGAFDSAIDDVCRQVCSYHELNQSLRFHHPDIALIGLGIDRTV